MKIRTKEKEGMKEDERCVKIDTVDCKIEMQRTGEK